MRSKWADIRKGFALLVTGFALGRLSKRAMPADDSGTLGTGGRSTLEALRIAEEYRKRGNTKLSK